MIKRICEQLYIKRILIHFSTIATERPVVLREVHMDNASKSAGYLDDGSPENSPWKALEVSFISGEPTTPIPSIEQGPIILKEEEFTGEGKDDEWYVKNFCLIIGI